jgi:hypothetical protein
VLFVLLVFFFVLPDAPAAATSPEAPTAPVSVPDKLRQAVSHKRQVLEHALSSLSEGHMPYRLRALRDRHEIVGERLAAIATGQETVEELLHGTDAAADVANNKPPMTLEEITTYLDGWIHDLHATLMQAKSATFEGIWTAYHDLTVKTLYPWDRDYLSRMPPRRDDGSIFLSVATYRDENCYNTVYNAYKKAQHPEKLFVGLVQQNCHAECKSGVLANLSMIPVEPDDDCRTLFCASDIGKEICARGQVRVLNIDEPESLGPYAARYFASKLWYGEQWFMQIDAHMTFAIHWDATSVAMLNAAPSEKPVLSHYPPGHLQDLEQMYKRPGSRLCGPVFATSDLESQIIRTLCCCIDRGLMACPCMLTTLFSCIRTHAPGLEGGGIWDDKPLKIPAFAPFTAAGYFVAHSDFLREVPFDPFLPWIFMGEEIIMSSRLWTSGYDIFSPTRSVVGHMYVRRHKPKVRYSWRRARNKTETETFASDNFCLPVLGRFLFFSFGKVSIGTFGVPCGDGWRRCMGVWKTDLTLPFL